MKYGGGMHQQEMARGRSQFKYEPALFPQKMIMQVTNGKRWHELSPKTRVAVN